MVYLITIKPQCVEKAIPIGIKRVNNSQLLVIVYTWLIDHNHVWAPLYHVREKNANLNELKQSC